MNEWLDDLSDVTAAGDVAVLVTVAAIRGSAPRETGAKMIVTAEETIGTIGGGQLEYQCTRIAADMLAGDERSSTRSFPLGAAMGQCCGGVVDILFEPIDARIPAWLKELCALHGQRMPAALVTGIGAANVKSVVTAEHVVGSSAMALPNAVLARAREILAQGGSAERIDDYFLEPVVGSNFNIAVFGAGHVGTAVVAAFSQLDCNIRWIDSRRNVFRSVPKNVRTIEAEQPSLEVAAMPPGSSYLVMTHSHAIDFDVCDRILRRQDAVYCGLIGSRTKRRRFEKRYRQQGMPEPMIAELICPIGVDGISGKKPAEIAVAAAAEVLQARELDAAMQQGDLPDNVRPLIS